MTKFIKQEYCTEFGYGQFNKYNKTDYSNWLEQKLLEAREQVKTLTIPVVSNWVAIESTKKPKVCSDVMIKYKDGWKAVALFDGDGRFYIEKDDRDVTETIVEWHELP